jgi:hypothetical protein
LRRADGDVKAAAMASIAGMEDWHARCLREKRARNRRARGSDSEVRVLRRVRMVGSTVGGGEVAKGAMLESNGEKILEILVLKDI